MFKHLIIEFSPSARFNYKALAICIFLGSLGGIAAIVTALVTGNITYYAVPAILLAVTLLFFALFLLMEIYALFTLPFSYAPVCGVLVVLFFVLVVAYVFHYYFLENSVQQMYKMRDEITRFLDPDVKA